MKRSLVFMLVVSCLLTAAPILAQDDIREFPFCKYCGMDRQKFSHSRILIEYEDGSKVGACSIHCAAVDLAINIDKIPKNILVADFNTKMLIDAGKAYWIIGGERPGVMTKRAKWAFKEMTEAEGFMKSSNGILSASEQVFKSAYEDMYSDTQMIREKRKAMRARHQH